MNGPYGEHRDLPARTFGGLPIVEHPSVPEGQVYIIPGQRLVAPPGFFADTLRDMPEPSVPVTQRILDRIRREAVVLLPIVLAIYSVWPAGVAVTDYKVWAPIVVGALLRTFFTSPTHEVEEKETDAFKAGVQLGKNLGPRP